MQTQGKEGRGSVNVGYEGGKVVRRKWHSLAVGVSSCFALLGDEV